MIGEPPSGEVRIGVFHSPRFPKSRRQPAIGLKSTALGKSKGDLQVHKDGVTVAAGAAFRQDWPQAGADYRGANVTLANGRVSLIDFFAAPCFIGEIELIDK